MSAQTKSSGGGNVWVRAIIGVVLMFAGFYVSKNVHLGFLESLEASGIAIDPGKTVAVIGVFLILFPVINMFFIQPLQDAIEERNTNLERTFSEAENLRDEMTKMRADYERRLAETEAQARAQIQAQIAEAQKLRQSLMAEAADKADALVREAEVKIAQERDSIINELRVQVVDLTLAAAEKVIGENMDTERNRRLVQEFVDNVEVAR